MIYNSFRLQKRTKFLYIFCLLGIWLGNSQTISANRRPIKTTHNKTKYGETKYYGTKYLNNEATGRTAACSDP
jgi:hypothetical protein